MEDNSKFKLTYDTLNSELSKLIIVYPPVFFFRRLSHKSSLIFVLYFTVSCICILIKNIIWREAEKRKL